MILRNHRRLVLAAAAVSLSGQAFGAYQVNVAVPLPYVSTDGTAAANSATYTSLNPTTLSRPTLPNGASAPTIIGSLIGTLTSNSAVSIGTAFAYDPTNGLRLIGRYTVTSTGAHTNANARYVNGVGQVIGSSPLNSSSSTDSNGILGTEAWLYTTTGNTNIALGLTGPNFSYQKTVPVNGTITPVQFTDTFRISTAAFLNDSGQVVGTSSRYAGDATTAASTSLGTSAYLYTPGAGTAEIGLFGTNYSYQATTGTTTGRYSSNGISGLTNTGIIIGSASPYFDVGNGTGTALGTDAWVSSNGATPTAIGFYQRGIDPSVAAAPGVVTSGFKYYFTPASGSLGTTPATSQSRQTSLAGLNASGQVIGTSSYYSGTAFQGTDAFVYSTATGQYRQLGFLTNGFTSATPAAGSSSYVSVTGGRSSTASYINAAGKIAGVSTQYFFYNNATNVSTPATGQVAWFDDGTGVSATPTRIGLFGQAADVNASRHVNPQTGVTNSAVTNLTVSGLVGGYSSRYYLSGVTGTALGQDAWVYNSNTGVTYLVDPTDAATGNYTSSSINYLSEDGVAVGIYQTSASTSSSGLYNKAFLWSLGTGFVDLNTNLSPALSTTAYQNLINSFFSTAGGDTLYASASKGLNTTIGGLVTLTPAVPEPTSLSAIAVGAAALLRRRRRAV